MNDPQKIISAINAATGTILLAISTVSSIILCVLIILGSEIRKLRKGDKG